MSKEGAKQLEEKIMSNPGKKKELMTEYINVLVDRLFNTFSEKDVLMVSGNKMYYMGNELSAEQRHAVISGADTIQKLEVWQALLAEMKYLANKRMFVVSKDIDDILFGKAMLYTIGILEDKVRNLSALKK